MAPHVAGGVSNPQTGALFAGKRRIFVGSTETWSASRFWASAIGTASR